MKSTNWGEIAKLGPAVLAVAAGMLTTCLVLGPGSAIAEAKYAVHKTRWELRNTPDSGETAEEDGLLQSLDLLPLVDNAYTAEDIKFTVTMPEKVGLSEPFKIKVDVAAKINAKPVQEYLEDGDAANDKLTKIENVGIVVDALGSRYVVDALPDQPGFLPVGENILKGSVEVDATLDSMWVASNGLDGSERALEVSSSLIVYEGKSSQGKLLYYFLKSE